MAIDFRGIIDRAANRVEKQEEVVIERCARDVLIDRAERHSEDVDKAMRDQGLSHRDLQAAAERQFKEALTGSNGLRINSRRINAVAVTQGMSRECHFVPWC